MPADPGVEVVDGDDLDARPVGAGLRAETAFDTGEIVLARIRLGEAGSGWHTHGDRDAYGVVCEGSAHIEYGPDGESAVEAAAGEFFHVPAGVVHRLVAPTEGLVALVAFVGTGEPVVAIEGPAADSPDRPPRVAGEDDLEETAPLANLTRKMPFPDAPVQQVRGHADGRVESEWHHHGANDVFGYVLRGEGYVEWGTGEGERKLAEAGEFFYVPAGAVHRDVNPGDDEQDYVLWLVGSEPRVVSVDVPVTDANG